MFRKSDEEMNQPKIFNILNEGKMAAFDVHPVLEKNQTDQGTVITFDGNDIDQHYEEESDLLALIVDIGTTTIVVSLVDVEKGVEISSKTGENPQREYGDDVLTRITYIQEHEAGLETMQKSVLQLIEDLGTALCEEHNYEAEAVYGIFVSGNTIMNHIIMGVSPVSLGISPYTLQFKDSQQADFEEMGFSVFGKGVFQTLPNISAFVGGDVTAGIISTEIYKSTETKLFVDVGTNGEIVLIKNGQLYSTSCAAGPAMEGMGITCGMTARQGSIEEAVFENGELKLQTINDEDPVGICGSGILALIREFLKVGLIIPRGNIAKPNQVPEKYHAYLMEDVKGLWVDKAHNIYLTQQDIRKIQLAKGAILSGIQYLLKESELEPEAIDQCFIAGQFGSYVSPESFTRVGILPKVLEDKVDYVGNTSKSGAFMVAMNQELYHKMDDMIADVRHIELSLLDDYDRVFAYATFFPERIGVQQCQSLNYTHKTR
jgi:uncharacterized 2Fe-2S/4Fe-4S cluster protein (DUF4445 family)